MIFDNLLIGHSVSYVIVKLIGHSAWNLKKKNLVRLQAFVKQTIVVSLKFYHIPLHLLWFWSRQKDRPDEIQELINYTIERMEIIYHTHSEIEILRFHKFLIIFILWFFGEEGKGYKNTTTIFPAGHKARYKVTERGIWEAPSLFSSMKRQDTEGERRIKSRWTPF